MPKCECCGQALKPKTRAKRKPTISLGTLPTNGRDWQRKQYDANMRIKRGELVWDECAHEGRFGARGDFVTPEQYDARRIDTYPDDNPESRLAVLQAALDSAPTAEDRRTWAKKIELLRNGVAA